MKNGNTEKSKRTHNTQKNIQYIRRVCSKQSRMFRNSVFNVVNSVFLDKNMKGE